MRAALWIPGRFSLTNAMLSNLRAAGYARGKAMRRFVDAFEQETKAIRKATVAAVRRCLSEVADAMPWERVDLEFVVFGHAKHDPDAWYLLGKAVTDGLVDAGVFASDRFDVDHVGGKVLRERDSEFTHRHSAAAEMKRVVVPDGQPGVLVWLTDDREE